MRAPAPPKQSLQLVWRDRRPDARTRRPREGVELPRWFSYAAIFVITAFVLHAFLVVVSLATGIVSEDSLLTMAGPVTFIVEFGLAAVITWLDRPAPGRAPGAQRRGAGQTRRRARGRRAPARPRDRAAVCGRAAPGAAHGRGGPVAQGARPARVRQRRRSRTSATVTSRRPTAVRCARSCSGRSTTPTRWTRCEGHALLREGWWAVKDSNLRPWD